VFRPRGLVHRPQDSVASGFDSQKYAFASARAHQLDRLCVDMVGPQVGIPPESVTVADHHPHDLLETLLRHVERVIEKRDHRDRADTPKAVQLGLDGFDVLVDVHSTLLRPGAERAGEWAGLSRPYRHALADPFGRE